MTETMTETMTTTQMRAEDLKEGDHVLIKNPSASKLRKGRKVDIIPACLKTDYADAEIDAKTGGRVFLLYNLVTKRYCRAKQLLKAINRETAELVATRIEAGDADPYRARDDDAPAMNTSTKQHRAGISLGSKPVKAKKPRKAADPKKKPQNRTKDSAPKMSQLAAAAIVLGKAKEPMGCQAIVAEMTKRGLWVSPGGKTPAATLSAAINTEIKRKGEASRFAKTAPGRFTLAKGGK